MTRRVASLVAFAACAALAQNAASPPAFEVGSVKPSPPPQGSMRTRGCFGGPGTRSPGQYVCTDATVAIMVRTAFGLRDYQLPGVSIRDGPSYDVRAPIPAGATQAQLRIMLQKLLIERFGLRYHFEKREMPLYRLTVSKGGPKLKASPPAPTDPTADGPGPPSSWHPGLYGVFMPAKPPRGGLFPTMANCTMGADVGGATTDRIGDYLSEQLGRPVNNATALKGEFDFVLVFFNENCEPSGSLPPSDDPTLSTAVEEQLGLKLEKGRGMVDVFLIDHLEKKPTAN